MALFHLRLHSGTQEYGMLAEVQFPTIASQELIPSQSFAIQIFTSRAGLEFEISNTQWQPGSFDVSIVKLGTGNPTITPWHSRELTD
jgi:hypothetical protein